MSLDHEPALSAQLPTPGLHAPLQRNKPSRWRRTLLVLVMVLPITSIIAVVNHIGVRMTGDVLAWRQWIRAHTLHFFIWRLFLYGIATVGWIWVRRRRLQRFPAQDMARQMLRTEIFLIAFVVIFEIQKWLRA